MIKAVLLSPLLIVFFLFLGCQEQPSPLEQEWVNDGFSLQQSRAYIAQHVSLVNARAWKKHGFSAQTAAEWIEISVKPDDAVLWIERDKSPIEVKQYIAIGLSVQEFDAYNALQIDLHEMKLWKRSGLPFEQIGSAVQLHLSYEQYRRLIKSEHNYTPKLYKGMGGPIFSFYSSCVAMMDEPSFQSLHLTCQEFTKEVDRLRFMGLLLDRQRKKESDLLLDYLEGLRALNAQYLQIVDSLVLKQNRAIATGDSALFSAIFNFLPMPPSEAEIAFIESKHLNFDGNARYLRYDNANYWQSKSEREQQARIKAQQKAALLEKLALQKQLKEQAQLKRALLEQKQVQERVAREMYLKKQADLKAKQLQAKALRLQTIQSKCAPFIEQNMLSNKTVLLMGKVVFEIEAKGSKFYTIGVYDKRTETTYLVRDPKAQASFKRHHQVQWVVKTLGRRSRVNKVANSYSFDKKGEMRFDTSKFVRQCQF